MFNKESNVSTNTGAETVIGPSIKVKGDFHGEGNIVIEGQVEGEVSTNQNLVVGANAKISANIKANDANIAGVIEGDVEIKGYLEIKSSANIRGNVKAGDISIEKGAKINGMVDMGGKNENNNLPSETQVQ